MRLGLERMRALLARLGNPQRSYPAIHVVGTNGKSTTTRMVEALLLGDGLRVGSYVSPHVVRFAERIRVVGEEADLDGLLERIAPEVEVVDDEAGDRVTQFEVLTAAAFLAFAEASVEAAVVEAGLGGRHDATNVLEASVVCLTNVGLDHARHLGPTRETIAAEKLAVVRPGATVVLGEPGWEEAARAAGARRVVAAEGNLGVAAAAAQAFLGHPVDTRAAVAVRLPGRLEQVAEAPLELWDGAHNPEGVRYLLAELPRRQFVLVASILRDKRVDEMLELFSRVAPALIATSSRNPRALHAKELARLARPFFSEVKAIDDPLAALISAREAAGLAGAVLVSGSLYLLADLAAVRPLRLP